MMKSRKLGIGLLLMLAVVVTTGTFAYWASSLSADSATNGDVTVTIGTGAAESSTLTLTAYTSNTGSALVPTGNGAAGADTATWTIPMDWDQDSGTEFAGATGDLTITNVTYAMTGFTSAELEVLFSASIPVTELTEGAASQNVVLSVVFDTEPTDKAEYDLIKTGTLTITVEFTVNPN